MFPGLVCPTCEATYADPPACSNPACTANPSLSEATRAMVVARAEAYAREKADREYLARARAQAMARP